VAGPGQHDIKVLNTLIETTLDSVDGYTEAAKDAGNPGYKMLFERRAAERRRVVNNLQGTVRSLGGEPEDDGSVLASRADGTAIGRVAKPWARDANGAEVPTHFEIAGTTLTQIIDHRSGPYAYPIVADPFWDTAWKVTKCAGAIAATVFVGSKSYKIIKELGGAWNAAKLLVMAGNFHDFAASAGAAAAGVLGVDTIRKNCF